MPTTAEYVDPRAEGTTRLAAQLELLNRRAPQYMSAAERDQRGQLGLLGMLSGDQGLAAVGGQLLGQVQRSEALEDQDLTHQRQLAQARLDRMQERSASARDAFAEARQRATEKAEEARIRAQEQGALHAMIASNRGEPLMAVMGPNGQPVYVPRSQAVGQQPASIAQGQPTEDERRAAGWLQQAQLAYANMGQATRRAPEAAKPTLSERALGMVPGFGQDMAFAAMTPERQQYSTAASSLSEAILRAATGAGVNESEARQKVQELTPRYGESAASVADKQQRGLMYLNALQSRAGRAVQTRASAGGTGAAGAGASASDRAADDPLGLRQ